MTRDFSFTTATQQVSSQSQHSVSAVRHNGQFQQSDTVSVLMARHNGLFQQSDTVSVLMARHNGLFQQTNTVSAVRYSTLFQQSDTTLCFNSLQHSVSGVRHNALFQQSDTVSVLKVSHNGLFLQKIWFQHSDTMLCFSSQAQCSVLAVRHYSVSAVRCNTLFQQSAAISVLTVIYNGLFQQTNIVSAVRHTALFQQSDTKLCFTSQTHCLP